jgi:hypothetical protein
VVRTVTAEADVVIARDVATTETPTNMSALRMYFLLHRRGSG